MLPLSTRSHWVVRSEIVKLMCSRTAAMAALKNVIRGVELLCDGRVHVAHAARESCQALGHERPCRIELFAEIVRHAFPDLSEARLGRDGHRRKLNAEVCQHPMLEGLNCRLDHLRGTTFADGICCHGARLLELLLYHAHKDSRKESRLLGLPDLAPLPS